ncbi:hypothetical protein [Streptomyces luteireticuli]|uniref:Uncharacterized protein n=1 Tax=Streptomyces luteireticuli TaxID=173858 RepID=A0ABN0Y5W6_9ACTN
MEDQMESDQRADSNADCYRTPVIQAAARHVGHAIAAVDPVVNIAEYAGDDHDLNTVQELTHAVAGVLHGLDVLDRVMTDWGVSGHVGEAR